MISDIRKEIIKDFQITKFGFYGLLKNLRFFEPYLLIFFMEKGINLFQIGILIAIREVIVNLFEVPSGFVADYFGRKKEMYFCFSFYIISFIFFFLTNSFLIASVAMIFFGLGEAFRSGTHKAMIYTYLDNKNWEKEKTFVYGRTRSFSLIGSAISAVIGIALILLVPSVNYIFLFSIIPYLLDLALIISYPKFLDKADKKKKSSFKDMFSNLIGNFRSSKFLRGLVLEEGILEASVSYVKDLIQPLLELIIIGSGIVVISNLSVDDNLKIILGIVYAVLNLISSVTSKKAYILQSKMSSRKCLFVIHLALAFLLGILAFLSKAYIAVCIVYLFIYILQSMRKPIYIDEVDNYMEKSNRATVLSISSQLKSLFLMIFAPLLGFVADNFGINIIMIFLSLVFICSLPLLRKKE